MPRSSSARNSRAKSTSTKVAATKSANDSKAAAAAARGKSAEKDQPDTLFIDASQSDPRTYPDSLNEESFFASMWPKPYIAETDFADYVYRPHTITTAVMGFMTMFGVIFYFQVVQWSPVKAGILAAVWSFLLFGMIYLPDGALVRPHPAVWRGFLALAVAYMMLMIFFFTLPLKTTKEVIGLYDPVVLQDAPEQSYAEDCRMSTPEDPFKFFHTVADIFLLAHALGYTVKMMVIRDWRIVTFISLIFEVIEVSGQHVLENFKECWWDHVIVDVLICNALGTYLGHLILRYFQAKKYSWSRLRDIKGIKGKTKRIVGQLFPRESPVNYSWPIFDRPKNLSIGFLLVVVILTEEVNCFTMKNILNLSPKHHLVVFRLVMMGFFALPGLRQFHDFAYDPRVKRLGAMAWVGATLLFFETAWICKMIVEGGYFRDPWPPHIILPWIYNIITAIVWVTLHFGIKNKSTNLDLFLKIIFYSMPLAFVAQFFMGNVDLGYGAAAFDNWSDKWGIWPKVPVPVK